MRHRKIQDLLGAYLDNELKEKGEASRRGTSADLPRVPGGARAAEEAGRVRQVALSRCSGREPYWEAFPARVRAAVGQRLSGGREKEAAMFQDSFIVPPKKLRAQAGSSRSRSPPTSIIAFLLVILPLHEPGRSAPGSNL